MDELASEYIEMLWETGETKSSANHCLAALQYFRPQPKQHLQWSWKLTKVWNQVEAPKRATPMPPPEVLVAFAGTALQWQQPTFAWLIVVGYSLFLRTGELLALKPSDVAASDNQAVVFISSSKGTQRNFLPLERLEVTEETPLQALRHLCKAHKSAGPFWTADRRKFMELWDSIVQQLELGGYNDKPYSLRRGAAATAYKNGVPLDLLLSKGRWHSLHTARIYFDIGLQAMARFATLSQTGARGMAGRSPSKTLGIGLVQKPVAEGTAASKKGAAAVRASSVRTRSA
eukprot:Skav203324  [mRNA]  locus=scaffold284:204377:205240:- [translate_table: standard]